MNIQADIQKTKELVDKAQNILVATHEHPTADSIASSLSLYLGLVSLGKRVTITCPDPITVDLSGYIGVNKITQEFGKKNFIISLDYVDGSIEKVSYNIEGDKFNLVIEPRSGFELFSEDKVHYTTSGAGYDIIFTVDTIHLGGLKSLYESEKDIFATKPIVNIDRHPNNSMYGQINIVHALASSTSELSALVLSGLGVKLSQDIAANLLNGLYEATNNFQNPGVTSTAFEVASVCVKSGGKRFQSVPQPAEDLAYSAQSQQGILDGKQPKPIARQQKEPTPAAPVRPSAFPVASPTAPPSAVSQAPAASQAPDDWLKPKIFKSSNLL